MHYHIHNVSAHFLHLIHMFICCITGLGIGFLAIFGYKKSKENKNHNP